MKKDNDFSPAEGVSIENALRYVEAIGQAIKRDIMQLPFEERGFIIGLLAGALLLEAKEIDKYRKTLIDLGQAVPMTAKQQEQFEWMMHRIFDTKHDS